MATEKERTQIDEESMIVVGAMRLRHEDQMATGCTGTLYGDAVKVIEQHQAEITRLRVDAARYLWLNEDGDRCAQVVLDAYSDWDTDVHWDEHFDAAITESMRRADDCMFPDCGCDGARLCMAKNGANSAAMVLNISRKSSKA